MSLHHQELFCNRQLETLWINVDYLVVAGGGGGGGTGGGGGGGFLPGTTTVSASPGSIQ